MKRTTYRLDRMDCAAEEQLVRMRLVATLLIQNRARRGEAHVEASWIFTSNDIKVNGLVIISGLLVWVTASRIPDLLAGGLIFLIVARGARQILALSASSIHRQTQ